MIKDSEPVGCNAGCLRELLASARTMDPDDPTSAAVFRSECVAFIEELLGVSGK